ncbi:MAG TPA: restriction endonuclease [Desulfatiglandales bacterium]|nr:restriction endonuclease [Desulfatiglandales bacterium]
MGAQWLIYDETANELKRLGWWGKLSVEGTRKVMEGSLRYCLKDNMLYLPQDQGIIEEKHRLCWGRARFEESEDHPWLDQFERPLEVNPLDYHDPVTGIGFGVMYSKRHREAEDGRIPVKSFISQSIIDAIAENPEVLNEIDKNDFEALMAEMFARMGFDVELYRGSKDDGIDFLRIDIDNGDPVIACVQCKHPDKAKPGKRRRSLPVATVREIYGVAKAHELSGCIAITSSTYTPAAKKFADLKPEEISVANVEDVIKWVRQYRWNVDE